MVRLAEPQARIALATLTALEIVLGIDNIICISILSGRPPVHLRGDRRPGRPVQLRQRVGPKPRLSGSGA